MSIYDQLVQAGVEIDSHESDLYCKVTDASRKIVKESGLAYTVFTSQIDCEPWYEIPFMYEPWWTARSMPSLS
jgi:hypothetical protein